MDDNWVVECSDDENYDTKNRVRIVNGKKIWEPPGAAISHLYLTLEKKGAIDLVWQCPGRRSPSVNSLNFNVDKKTSESNDNQNKANAETHEFDFDDEFSDVPSRVSVPKRKSQGTKKVAKLDKVMNDIRKYKIMDQQTRKSFSGNEANDS